METQTNTNDITSGRYTQQPLRDSEIVTLFKNTDEFKNFFQEYRLPNLDDLLMKLAAPVGKKSFLVFKNNKYINVLTENIAFFYVKYESSIIMCFDGQEYFVNYSLEQIQNLLTEKQFFRLNRQYLIVDPEPVTFKLENFSI